MKILIYRSRILQLILGFFNILQINIIIYWSNIAYYINNDFFF